MAKKKLVKGKLHQIYKTWSGRIVPGSSGVCKIGDDLGGIIHWAWRLGKEGKDYRKEKGAAADTGTICHFMIECYLSGDEPDLSDYDQKDINKAMLGFDKFRAWWEKEKLEHLGSEIQLVSNKHGYGGTIDSICRDPEGRICVLDFKTSNSLHKSMYRQIGAYENLWGENNPDMPAERRALIRLGKDASDIEERWLPPLPDYFETFLAQLKVYELIRKER